MSDRSFSAKGLVLAERTVGDWDKSLVLLCEGVGKINVWARGAKRIKGPLLAAGSLFCYADYTLQQRGDRITATAAEVIESFFALRRDLTGLALANYIAELCRELCAENQPEDLLLRMTLNALYAIAGAAAQMPVIKAGYELRALSESGFLPILKYCISCGSADKLCAFTPLQNGVLCSDCVDLVTDALPMQPSTLSALRHLCTVDARRLYAFRLPLQPVLELERICESYTLATLGHPLKTLSFYHSLKEMESPKNLSDPLDLSDP